MNSMLMYGDCVGERLALVVVLRYDTYKKVKFPSFGCKVPFWCVMVKWQLRCIRTASIYSLFGGRLGLLQVRDCNGGEELRLVKTMGLNSVGERARKCDRENREWRLRQIKPTHSDRWYLDLVVKRLA